MKKIKIPFEFGKKMHVPKTAQDTIPFIEAYDNGIFLTGTDCYTLIFAFENLDYSLLRDMEQRETYENYQRLLNAIPPDVTYQEFIMNSDVNTMRMNSVLIPSEKSRGKLYEDYCRIQKNNIRAAENASSDKILLIALCYKPQFKIDNVNVLFKYYREMQTYFASLKSSTRLLMPEEVFSILHEFYHPFEDEEFLLPKNVYAKGGSIKDYIAPSIFAFKAKEIHIGNCFTRVLFIKRYDRELDDGLIRDLLDNNSKLTVSKHLRRYDKSFALDKVKKAIFNVQETIQNRKEKNYKRGTDFIPFRLMEKLKELENIQERLSNSNCELFEVGVYVALSETSKERLDELTRYLLSKAQRHQIKLDVLLFQQNKGLDTVLPFGVNHFSEKNGNNINTHLLTDEAGVLIPFSTRGYFTDSGICYGLNKTTNAIIILDRTDELNANGFTLGTSGSGKSMQTKIELSHVSFKCPNDEIIVIDPENEYLSLIEPFNGEVFKLSANSTTKLNVFDTDISYTEDGLSAISMKSEFIMTIVETAKGLPLTAEEKSLIDRCVKIIYADFVETNGNKSKLPTFHDFYDMLLKQNVDEATNIAVALELYIKGSFDTFAGKTNFNANKKFLVIDISEMGEQLRTVGLQIILEFVWQRVIENKKRGVRTWV